MSSTGVLKKLSSLLCVNPLDGMLSESVAESSIDSPGLAGLTKSLGMSSSSEERFSLKGSAFTTAEIASRKTILRTTYVIPNSWICSEVRDQFCPAAFLAEVGG